MNNFTTSRQFTSLSRKTGARLRPACTGSRMISGDRARKRPTIVVATNHPEASNRALEYAVDCARRLNARIVVAHVLESSYAEGFLEAHQTKQLRAQARQLAEDRLKQWISSKNCAEIPIVLRIRSGVPEREILEMAELVNAEFIVLGRRKRGSLSRLIFGSVTENILDTSRFPVMVIGAHTE